ncbi:hypothetical protein KSP39_PZI008551 [Platanthera zijinensis]|uniref:Uncharacterized protein n=1 Tax=Platanthera zijinensis TaxID=2320716 RepID=A0AAP0BMD0_9ASPA
MDELVEISRIIGQCMQESPHIQISSSLFTIPEAISELETMTGIMDELKSTKTIWGVKLPNWRLIRSATPCEDDGMPPSIKRKTTSHPPLTNHLVVGTINIVCRPTKDTSLRFVTYRLRKHLIDVTEIFSQLNGEKTHRLAKLIYLVVLLFLSLFWYAYGWPVKGKEDGSQSGGCGLTDHRSLGFVSIHADEPRAAGGPAAAGRLCSKALDGGGIGRGGMAGWGRNQEWDFFLWRIGVHLARAIRTSDRA